LQVVEFHHNTTFQVIFTTTISTHTKNRAIIDMQPQLQVYSRNSFS
jgi:hypothetical protein